MKDKQWDLSSALSPSRIFGSKRRKKHFSKCCETFAFKYIFSVGKFIKNKYEIFTSMTSILFHILCFKMVIWKAEGVLQLFLDVITEVSKTRDM